MAVTFQTDTWKYSKMKIAQNSQHWQVMPHAEKDTSESLNTFNTSVLLYIMSDPTWTNVQILQSFIVIFCLTFQSRNIHSCSWRTTRECVRIQKHVPGFGLDGELSVLVGLIPISLCLNISRGLTERWEMRDAASCYKHTQTLLDR